MLDDLLPGNGWPGRRHGHHCLLCLQVSRDSPQWKRFLYTEDDEISFFYPISNPAFCTATSTLVCGRLGVGFLLPSFSTCTSSSWTTGGVVQLLFSSFLLSPSFIQASHMAHRAQPCCQQEPRPSHLSIQVFTWSLINFLLALYGAQFSLAHLEISHPTQSNLIYLKNI